MDVLSADETEKLFLKDYNSHPEGWKWLRARDTNGLPFLGAVNYELGVQYWLKAESPYCSSMTGFKDALKDDFAIQKSPKYDENFGIRFVEMDQSEREALKKNGRMIGSLLKKLSKSMKNDRPSEVDKEKITSGNYVLAVSPYVTFLHPTSLADISPSQRKLEDEMNAELKKIRQSKTNYIH